MAIIRASAIVVLASVILILTTPFVVSKELDLSLADNRPICIPAGGDDFLADDVPAIVAAFNDCSQGGIIMIPTDKTYSIRSQLSIPPCNECDFQIRGKLVVRNTTASSVWPKNPTIIQLNGAKDIKITGGDAALDTNNTENGMILYDEYVNWGSYSIPTFFNISTSSDVAFSNLFIRVSRGLIFDADKSSSDLLFSNLTLDTKEDAGSGTGGIAGALLSGSSRVIISNLSARVRGYCIKTHRGLAECDRYRCQL